MCPRFLKLLDKLRLFLRRKLFKELLTLHVGLGSLIKHECGILPNVVVEDVLTLAGDCFGLLFTLAWQYFNEVHLISEVSFKIRFENICANKIDGLIWQFLQEVGANLYQPFSA